MTNILFSVGRKLSVEIIASRSVDIANECEGREGKITSFTFMPAFGTTIVTIFFDAKALVSYELEPIGASITGSDSWSNVHFFFGDSNL